MIVRCENCQTEFALDDAQVGPEGVTVRCSVCAYVFKVRPPAGSAGDQPWQIQTTEDLLFTAPTLEALKAWIVEGRLHPEDRVSRTGNHWLRLGEMPEFSSMFAGHGDLPKVFEAVSGRPRKPDSERSAVDELGPPPVFGSEVSGVKLAAETSKLGSGPAAPRPSSPLDAVTKHTVRPITSPALEHASSAAKRSASTREPSAEAWDEPRAPRGARPSWMLWAGLGVASAVALVFGVPQIRGAILGGEPAPTELDAPEVAAPEPRPELERAGAALKTLGVADIGRAEAAIQRAIDTGAAEQAALASLKLAQADLLVSRALVYTMAAAIDQGRHDQLIKRADDDLDHASRVFDNLGSAPDGERVSLVRARIRLAQGRDGVEILALLPETGAEEMQLAVEAAPLWRERDVRVPANLVGRLQALDGASALGRSVLALALLRAGDRPGAEKVADQLLADAADHPVGLAIREPGTEQPDPIPEPEPTAETGEAPEIVEPEPADGGAVAERPSTTGGTKAAGTGGASGSGGGGSFEKLLEKGCEQVESADAAAGVQTLLKAFDRNPRDLDVLVCLGKGYEKTGNDTRALHFYERALEQSPRHRSALRGAASVAASTGSTSKAMTYYERLLQVDPMNAKAKLYVEQHGGKPSGGGPPSDGDSGGGQPPPSG